MAYTVTTVKNTIWGDQRVIHYAITADATTQTVATGLGYIDGISVTAKSATSGLGKFKLNVNASGVAANGSFGMSSIVSGDEYYVTVYGR